MLHRLDFKPCSFDEKNMPLLSEFVTTACAHDYNHFTPSELPASARANFFVTHPIDKWHLNQTRAPRGFGQTR